MELGKEGGESSSEGVEGLWVEEGEFGESEEDKVRKKGGGN